MSKECNHHAKNGSILMRSLLTLNDATGEADYTQLYYQCSNCFTEFVITINALDMTVIKPMKKLDYQLWEDTE